MSGDRVNRRVVYLRARSEAHMKFVLGFAVTPDFDPSRRLWVMAGDGFALDLIGAITTPAEVRDIAREDRALRRAQLRAVVNPAARRVQWLARLRHDVAEALHELSLQIKSALPGKGPRTLHHDMARALRLLAGPAKSLPIEIADEPDAEPDEDLRQIVLEEFLLLVVPAHGVGPELVIEAPAIEHDGWHANLELWGPMADARQAVAEAAGIVVPAPRTPRRVFA